MNITNITKYIKQHSVLATTIAIGAIVIMVIAGRMAARGSGSALLQSGDRQVTEVDVSLFRQDTSVVSANGTVESLAQADLKSQISAPVSYLALAVGDPVFPGQVIMELKNNDIKARLDQAKAALALANGQSETSFVSLGSARTNAIDRARDAYAAADQAVRGQIDQFLFSASGGVSSLSSHVSDYALIDRLHTTRDDLSNYFAVFKPQVDALSQNSSDTEILAALAEAKIVLGSVAVLLDDVTVALNGVSKDTSATDLAVTNGWKSTASSAKAAISASSASITLADTSLRNAFSSHGTSADAGIASAEAGVKSLEAELAKTIIVSPLYGKVAGLPLHVGELASPGTLLATVVGGQGLQVKAFISSEDISRVTKGAHVLIQGTVQGVVSAVSPSVNQVNKKVEVTIAISNPDSSGLVVGQSITANIASNTSSSGISASYFLPIQDIKIVPGEAYVFTLDSDSRVVKHPVILGAVSGDFIEVKEGLSDDMKIVTPVYDLEEGQRVNVSGQ